MRKTTFLLMATLLLAFGCDSAKMEEMQQLDPGEFSATVTGSQTVSFSGPASARVDGSFVLSLGPGDKDSVFLQAGTPNQLPLGDYGIAANPGGDVFKLRVIVNSNTIFNATSGTVTLTKSDSKEVVGSFTATANGEGSVSGETVSISGTFRSVFPVASE